MVVNNNEPANDNLGCSTNYLESPDLNNILNVSDLNNVQAYLPHPQYSGLSYTIEWAYKKGKLKPQQYWVYCEDSQSNYAKITFQIQGYSWGEFSRIVHFVDNDKCLILVENMSLDTVRGIQIDMNESAITGYTFVENVPQEKLTVVQTKDLRFILELKEDDTYPVHPNQGKSIDVKITRSTVQGSTPFRHIEQYHFKNRSEGWFRLEATLLYQNHVILFGLSSLFMFNNPRMKNKKNLTQYSSDEIKYMQIYSLSPQKDEDYWVGVGICLGYEVEKIFNLISLANELFGSSKRKRTDIINSGHITPDDPNIASANIINNNNNDSNLISSGNLGPKKKNRTEDNYFDRRDSNLLPNPYDNDSVIIDEFLSAPSSVATCGNTDRNSLLAVTDSQLYPILCQKLSPDGQQLERECFIPIYVTKSISLDDIIYKVRNKFNVQPNEVGGLYSLLKGNVIQLIDNEDLQFLLQQNEIPKILISPPVSPDFKPPPNHLFIQSDQAQQSNPPSQPQVPQQPQAPVNLLTQPLSAQVAPEVEYTYTVNNSGDIREIYTNAATLNALLISIAEEFGKDVDDIAKICKAATQATLSNDKNVQRLKETDILLVFWK